MNDSRRSSASRLLWRLASASRATHSVAVVNCHALTGQAGADRDGDREVGLAGAGWAEQDDVLARVQEVELAQALDDLALDRALEGEAELLERLARGQARGLDAALAAVALAARRPRSRARLRRSADSSTAPRAHGRRASGQGAGGGRRLERPEQVREL